jgi:hypothetical protein
MHQFNKADKQSKQGPALFSSCPSGKLLGVGFELSTEGDDVDQLVLEDAGGKAQSQRIGL